MNKKYYKKMLEQLRDMIRKNNQICEKMTTGCCIVIRLAYSSIYSTIFFDMQLCQHLYSSDLVPCDFWELKNTLKGKRFNGMKEVKQNAMKRLLAVPKIKYKECF